jgi:uncharacterized membrane protein affecting hemolysin expression
MFSQFINWRTTLAVIAIAIVTGTIFYSNYLSKKIASDERRKVNIWAESLKTRSTTTDQSALNLTNIITNENDKNTVPTFTDYLIRLSASSDGFLVKQPKIGKYFKNIYT